MSESILFFQGVELIRVEKTGCGSCYFFDTGRDEPRCTRPVSLQHEFECIGGTMVVFMTPLQAVTYKLKGSL